MRIFDDFLISKKVKIKRKFVKPFINVFPNVVLNIDSGIISKYLSKRYNINNHGYRSMYSIKNDIHYYLSNGCISSYIDNRVYLRSFSLSHNGDYITPVKRKDIPNAISNIVSKSEVLKSDIDRNQITAEVLKYKILRELERLDILENIIVTSNQYMDLISFTGKIDRENINNVLSDLSYISHILSDMNITLTLLFYTRIEDLIVNITTSEDMYLHDFNFKELSFCLVLNNSSNKEYINTFYGSDFTNHQIGKNADFKFDNIKVRVYAHEVEGSTSMLIKTKVFIPLEKVLSLKRTDIIYIKPTKVVINPDSYFKNIEVAYNA